MYPQTSLQPGQTGNSVKQLQDYLVSQGFLTKEQVKTGYGIYGPQTTRAVKSWQETNGVDNSSGPGYWGPRSISTAQKVGSTSQPTPDYTAPNQTIPTQEQVNPEDARIKALEAVVATIPSLKEASDILRLQIDTQIEQGKKVNPDLTITPELAQKFVDQASSELDPYYQELINQHKQDLTISFRQMQEDYTKQIEREQPAFKQSLENLDQTAANQGMAFSSGRVAREQQAIQGEQQKLDDLFTTNQRSVEKTGLASERAIGSRNFADLGIPTLQSYSASRNTIAPRGELTPSGSRSLYTPQTGLYGTLPAQQKVDIAQRTGELTDIEQNKRILEAGGLTRTI